MGFRPLARWIGSYTVQTKTMEKITTFPAPREVDRFLYTPSFAKRVIPTEFPAPLEVDRYLYANVLLTIKNQAKTSFQPLAR